MNELTLSEVLRGGRQCDMDGCEIIMSRQACCVAADQIESDAKRIAELEADKAKLTVLVDELRHQIAKMLPVVTTAQEWSGERELTDWAEGDLMKAIWTYHGDNTACPECDGDCGEPCAPCTVAEAHAGIDATLERLVKEGKLYRGTSFADDAATQEQGK